MMKGTILLWINNYKKLFIGCGIAYLVIVILTAVVTKTPIMESEYSELYISMLAVAVGLITIIPGESMGKFISNNVKLKYTDYLLSCSKTAKNYMLNEALIHLICFTTVTALFSAYIGYSYLLTGGMMDGGDLKLGITFMLFAYFINWLGTPIIIKMRSEEKAGLTIGIAVAVILTPLFVYSGYMEGAGEESTFLTDLGNTLVNWYNHDLFLPIYIGIIAVICVIVYYISVAIIRKGDVC